MFLTFFCQEGWAMQAGTAHVFFLSDLHLQTLQTPLCHHHLASWQMCSLCLQVQRWTLWHSSIMPLQFRNLMTSCVNNMKGMALTKAGDRSSWSLSTLKRKGKITPKLVIEENSNVRSNRSTVGSSSFLISISNTKDPQRDRELRETKIQSWVTFAQHLPMLHRLWYLTTLASHMRT